MLLSLLKDVAKRAIQDAIRVEIDEYLADASEARDPSTGWRLVNRNGSYPRQYTTPLGKLNLDIPRVYDQRPGHKFVSKILPPYARRSPTLDAVIPALYLKGISSGDMMPILHDLFSAEQIDGLTPTGIDNLRKQWYQEYLEWTQRDLSKAHYRYVWVDALYFTVKDAAHERVCILCMLGCTYDGRKELLALRQGWRESTITWTEMIADLIARGLSDAPEMVIADGALGIWQAVDAKWPQSLHQRCWIHKMRNVLDKLPKSLHSMAQQELRDIFVTSSDKASAVHGLEAFVVKYAKYRPAVESLKMDAVELFSYMDAAPMNTWSSLRSTNAIESLFSTVRQRTKTTRGLGSSEAILGMVYKLIRSQESRFKKLSLV